MPNCNKEAAAGAAMVQLGRESAAKGCEGADKQGKACSTSGKANA